MNRHRGPPHLANPTFDPALSRTRGPWAIYNGIPTAVLGAMPSSALYFGTYEAVKTRLIRVAAEKFPEALEGGGGGGGVEGRGGTRGIHPAARAGAHAVAAACGNAASSLVFVPKEYVKQTLQVGGRRKAGVAFFHGTWCTRWWCCLVVASRCCLSSEKMHVPRR